MRDARLDLWIDRKLLRRSARGKLGCPSYTKFANRAILLLADLEMTFSIQRRDDLKFEVRVLHHMELANNLEELAMAICLCIFRVVEGSPWPYEGTEKDGA